MKSYRNRIAILLFIFGGLAACDETKGVHGKSCSDVLELVRTLSPTGEAKNMMNKGDRRFLAIHNYTTLVPGANDDLVRTHGYRIIRKSSDVIDGDQCAEFQDEAYRFAEAYNHEIVYLSWIKSHENRDK